MDQENLIKESAKFIEISDDMLADVKRDVQVNKSINIPINEFASLSPQLEQFMPLIGVLGGAYGIDLNNINALTNLSPAEIFNKAKNVPALNTMASSMGIANLSALSAEELAGFMLTYIAAHPELVLVTAAVYTVNEQITTITNNQRQIISFLENDKQSEVEADVETLVDIIKKYKNNWDNEKFMASNHKMVLDIQRTARKNMNAYQKNIEDIVSSKNLLVAQNKVNSTVDKLIEKFRYYKLSLYTFSLASLLEIMLSGNFNEEYMMGIRDETKSLSYKYREKFSESSVFLERMSNKAIEANLLRTLGSAQDNMGKLVKSIPLAHKKSDDNAKPSTNSSLTKNANEMEAKSIKTFAKLNNPDTGMFTDKIEDMNRIYNHADRIYLDKDNLYVVAD